MLLSTLLFCMDDGGPRDGAPAEGPATPHGTISDPYADGLVRCAFGICTYVLRHDPELPPRPLARRRSVSCSP